jgi:hypothetical protein
MDFILLLWLDRRERQILHLSSHPPRKKKKKKKPEAGSLVHKPGQAEKNLHEIWDSMKSGTLPRLL